MEYMQVLCLHTHIQYGFSCLSKIASALPRWRLEVYAETFRFVPICIYLYLYLTLCIFSKTATCCCFHSSLLLLFLLFLLLPTFLAILAILTAFLVADLFRSFAVAVVYLPFTLFGFQCHQTVLKLFYALFSCFLVHLWPRVKKERESEKSVRLTSA